MSVSENPGRRYRVLAMRCRELAERTDDIPGKTGLLRMAWFYDLKAVDAVCMAISNGAEAKPASEDDHRQATLAG